MNDRAQIILVEAALPLKHMHSFGIDIETIHLNFKQNFTTN